MKQNREKREYIIIFICLSLIGICYVFFTSIFRYEDSISFTAWSVEFWDCLFNAGGPKYFYSYAMENFRNSFHIAPAGSWLTFFPWIIWNFPLWLTHMSIESDVTSQMCIVYSKSFLIVCLVLMNIYIYKIVKRLAKENSLMPVYAVILTVGGVELFDSVAYAGQDEIVYLSFFIASIYYIMINKKILSLLFGVVSVTVCPLMIIPYFFLVSIYEEKIYVTFLKIIISLTPTVLFEFFYRNDEVYSSLKGTSSLGIFQMMMNTATFPSTIGPVSIAAFAMTLLGFWCLFVKDDRDKSRKLITILAIVFMFMCFFMDTHFYRSCLYIPFIVMFACMEEKYISYKIPFILAMGISRFIFFLVRHSEYNASPRFLTGFVAQHYSYLPVEIINPLSSGLDTSFYIFRVLALASVILLFVLHFYREKIVMREFIPKHVVALIYSFQELLFVAYFFWVIERYRI